MIRDDFEKYHWEYYLLLEQEFDKLKIYIEPNEDNSGTYSMEFVRHLTSICAEIDSVFKTICNIDQATHADTGDYYPIMTAKYPSITEQSVRGYNMSIMPFKDWNSRATSRSLDWFGAFNDVKHSRVAAFKKANLKNTLQALAGLYILEMYYIREISDPNSDPDIPYKASKVFTMNNWHTDWMTNDGSFIGI